MGLFDPDTAEGVLYAAQQYEEAELQALLASLWAGKPACADHYPYDCECP